jgi:endogenous inhibitor of DNA gyrase (YacG/DUF329 family)
MKSVKCPTCEKNVEWSEKFPFRPFCSERCKLIDLGAWADGTYAIPSKEPIEDSDMLPDGSSQDED